MEKIPCIILESETGIYHDGVLLQNGSGRDSHVQVRRWDGELYSCDDLQRNVGTTGFVYYICSDGRSVPPKFPDRTPLADYVTGPGDAMSYEQYDNLRFGWCDLLGKSVLPARYEFLDEFCMDRSRAKLDGKWGLIDSTGAEIAPFIYQLIGRIRFAPGRYLRYRVRKDGRFGFLDYNGRVVIPFLYYYAEDFHDGIARVERDGFQGSIGVMGQPTTKASGSFSAQNLQEHVISGVMGLCIGDALGVPVEFSTREERKANPVTDMVGNGTYDLPAGTWSDDSSLTFCLMDAIMHGGGPDEILKNFCAWMDEGFMTPGGVALGIGRATRSAIEKKKKGVDPIHCGGTGERDNGNGALMRILPLAFYFRYLPLDEILRRTEEISSLTHRHPRSQIACGIYVIAAVLLIQGYGKQKAIQEACATVMEWYKLRNGYSKERAHFSRLPQIWQYREEEIRSTGYVVDTIEAAFWCFARSTDYASCVLLAVNLGSDTDTTAAVAGGLAGIFYGLDNIPTQWLDRLAKHAEIEALCQDFSQWIMQNRPVKR